jgi:cell division protease FtsH
MNFLFFAINIPYIYSFYIKNRYIPNFNIYNNINRDYNFGKKYRYDRFMRQLNLKNNINNTIYRNTSNDIPEYPKTIRVYLTNNIETLGDLEKIFSNYNNEQDEKDNESVNNNRDSNSNRYSNGNYDNDYYTRPKSKKSENFEIVEKCDTTFRDIGGYDNIKKELLQCVDILNNYTKYQKFSVRVPKGLILEGPPGNGKTLLAKAFAGEAKTAFIAVSGAQFQEKYIGIGSSRVRELFDLAKKNKPCIIFIDEIDAIGKKRSEEAESSTSERDNTLNELLVNLDGFNTQSGIFVIGATNRVDLLDPALIRPGRIDKKIYIGLPDTNTRNEILKIHVKGKPYASEINLEELVDLTSGLSGAQIENMLNEAMLYAIRDNREEILLTDLEEILNRIIGGWQSTEHKYDDEMIMRIAIHEIGHTIIGMLSKHHTKVRKVILNFNSPNTPGYTLFENADTNLYTREKLFEHLMILLAGRIAEELFYGLSVTTGASNDFSEALSLANKMIVYYGMGKLIVYPNTSEKYKQILDEEIADLLCRAYTTVNFILANCKVLIHECAILLKEKKILKYEEIEYIIRTRHVEVLNLKI